MALIAAAEGLKQLPTLAAVFLQALPQSGELIMQSATRDRDLSCLSLCRQGLKMMLSIHAC